MFIHICTVHLFWASDGCRAAVVMDVQCVLWSCHVVNLLTLTRDRKVFLSVESDQRLYPNMTQITSASAVNSTLHNQPSVTSVRLLSPDDGWSSPRGSLQLIPCLTSCTVVLRIPNAPGATLRVAQFKVLVAAFKERPPRTTCRLKHISIQIAHMT